MKKHLFLTFLLTFAAILTTEAQSLVNSGANTPTDIAQKVRQTAEKHLGVFNSQGNENNREYCDCDKCQKQNKSKKHDACNQKGKHYGKHKNQNDRHSCGCDHNSCQSNNKHNRDDDDCGYSHNGRNQDDNDRRYGSNDPERDVKYGETTRPAPRKPVAKVKTRPTPTAKPAPASSGAKKKVTPRPVSKS
ncbi:MAG TPA: hypothetical protein PK228_14560 [Saprospiraceae bacterium]|nr:hypothetical protein [Saprospiraceae bacterium]